MDEWEDIAVGPPVQSGGNDVWEDVAYGAEVQSPSVLGNVWEGVKDTPTAMLGAVKAAPSGLSNLLHSIFSPVQSLESGNTETVARGVGTIASGTAGAGAGAVLGALGGPLAPVTVPLGAAVGGASGLLGFDWLNQYLGSDAPTTPKEDVNQLAYNSGQGLVPGLLAKVVSKALPEKRLTATANSLDRKSIGARQSDYGRSASTLTVEGADGLPETFAKSVLDDLLQSNKLGTSRDPATLVKVVTDSAKDLAIKVDDVVKTYDAQGRPPVKPQFNQALDYIYSGKVPADLIDKYVKRLDELDQGIIREGKGKLSFLQQQKVAIGKSYDPKDAVKSGFDRAIYDDLKTSIESAVPEVGPLNAELAKFIVAEPIVSRTLTIAENKSPLTQLSDLPFTTGGIGAGGIIGSQLGGPLGTAIGLGVGLGGKALRSPTVQALSAKGLRGLVDLEIPNEIVGVIEGATSQTKKSDKDALQNSLESQSLLSRISGSNRSKESLDPSLFNRTLGPSTSQPLFEKVLGRKDIDELGRSGPKEVQAFMEGSVRAFMKEGYTEAEAKDRVAQLMKEATEGELPDFVMKEEGRQRLKAYPPPAEGSGVTVATGIDLGQRTKGELEDLGVSKTLISKVTPYLGKKNETAKSILKDNPLSLTKAEANELDSVIGKDILTTVNAKLKDQGVTLSKLPKEAQTVIKSLAWNFGKNFDEKLPTIWDAIVENDWERVQSLLLYTKWKQPQLKDRRVREAALLRPLIV